MRWRHSRITIALSLRSAKYKQRMVTFRLRLNSTLALSGSIPTLHSSLRWATSTS
jgi:hypothetical protein